MTKLPHELVVNFVGTQCMFNCLYRMAAKLSARLCCQCIYVCCQAGLLSFYDPDCPKSLVSWSSFKNICGGFAVAGGVLGALSLVLFTSQRV